jgi:hypothetical protein
MLRSTTSLLATLALVAASLTFGGCGGSSHPAASAKSHAAPSSSHVPSQCVSLSNGDPAAFTICLAKHGVHLSAGDGKLTTCVQSASDKDELDRCLSAAVR